MENVAYPGKPETRHRPVERLDGWKSIAAYLKRDRTTVIRWTQERGLPVHRVPGGRTGTVYALQHEVDQWLGMPGSQPEIASGAAPAPLAISPVHTAPPANPMPAARRWAIGLALAGLAIGVPAVLAKQGDAPVAPSNTAFPSLALPKNPAIAARFLTARDLIANRKAEGLERAIGLLAEVVYAAPNYAPGHATLAQALVLSREFGMRSDAEAFAQARIAAAAAIRLAPDMASGHRMLGFIAYWADRDFAQADAHFRRALALDPDDAYTHFWYGNILVDHGKFAAGLKALDQARLLLPGSVAIATDVAWAQWGAGQDAVAKATLAGIVADHPDFAIAYDCIANIALSEGDYAGYAHNFARYAALKQNKRLIADASAVQEAMRQGEQAGREEILRQARTTAAEERKGSPAWPALVASVAGERAQLIAILMDADKQGARWGDAALRLRIQRAWRDDPEITALLTRQWPGQDARA